MIKLTNPVVRNLKVNFVSFKNLYFFFEMLIIFETLYIVEKEKRLREQ
jgi:hypothetical protein